MSNLINFDFQSQTVRVELKNGEPLFCLTDVATILEISRSSDLLQVAKDTFVKNETVKRGALDPAGVHKMYSVDSKGRKNEITFINEPNLYRVIFRSNKAEAVKFQNWVFDEVLPTIRKTGQYTADRLTSTDTLPLRNAVNMATGILKLDYTTIYKMVHQRFGITDNKGSKIRNLTREQIPQAVEYVHTLILSAPKQDELDLASILNRETKRFVEHYNRMTWLARLADGESNRTFFECGNDSEHIAGLFMKNLLTQYRFEVEFDEGYHDNGSLKLKPISKQAFYSDLPSLPNVLQQQINKKLAFHSKLSETDVDTLCQVIDVCRLAVKNSL